MKKFYIAAALCLMSIAAGAQPAIEVPNVAAVRASAFGYILHLQGLASPGDGGDGYFLPSTTPCTDDSVSVLRDKRGRCFTRSSASAGIPSSAFSTLAQADAFAATVNSAVLVDKNWTLPANLTATAKAWEFTGGSIDVMGHALIVPTFSAPPYWIFSDSAGSGSVRASPAFSGMSVYAENFGAGFGIPANDESGVAAAIGFIKSATKGLELDFASTKQYTLCGPFTLQVSTAAQQLRLHGNSMLNNINHTCNNVLFTFLGQPTISVQHAMGSGADHLSIVGVDNVSFTSASAFQFSDSFGFDLHHNQISAYKYSPGVVVKNFAGFTEGFRAYDNIFQDVSFCYQLQNSGAAGTSASFRSLYIERDSCSLGANTLFSQAGFQLAGDGVSKELYDAHIDMLITAPIAGTGDYISIPNTGTNGTVNQILNSDITVRMDNIGAPITGRVVFALNRDSENLGRGEIKDSTVRILGNNPQTLDLSSGAAPSNVPSYTSLVTGQTNAGVMSATSDNRPIADVAGPRMFVHIPVAANRASYDWSIGPFPPWSRIKITISGTMAGANGSATWLISTRDAFSAPGIQLQSLAGFGTAVTLAASTGPQVTATINNFPNGTAADLNAIVEGLGQ